MTRTYATKHANVKRFDGVVIIKPHGSLMGGEETIELEKLFDEFDVERVNCLIVNLTDVGMMNSLAISRLITAHKKFKARGARMNLCEVDKRIDNVFVVTKLSLEFNVYPSEETAVAGCTSKPE